MFTFCTVNCIGNFLTFGRRINSIQSFWFMQASLAKRRRHLSALNQNDE